MLILEQSVFNNYDPLKQFSSIINKNKLSANVTLKMTFY